MGIGLGTNEVAVNDHFCGATPHSNDGVRAMRITLTAKQAEDLQVQENMELVRACFYLGMNINQITRLVRSGSAFDFEKKSICETATDLGMLDSDEVITVGTENSPE